MPQVVATGIYFGEGPRWHDGRLWFSDFFAHCVYALEPGGTPEVMLRLDGQPSGLGWLPDGRLLVVSMLDHRVLCQQPDGTVTTHADASAYAQHWSNDMTVDAAGRAYVGNFGFDPQELARTKQSPPPTSLTRVDPDGSVHEAAAGLMFPNGTVLTPDGTTMIIAETYGARLTAFDIAPDGTLSGRRTWADLRGTGIWPDGICLDSEGAVWVASAASPVCARVTEGGQITERVTFSQNCFACMLGGDDRRTLYALTAPTSEPVRAAEAPCGRVEQVRVSVTGTGRP